jgi:hypothetical protein
MAYSSHTAVFHSGSSGTPALPPAADVNMALMPLLLLLLSVAQTAITLSMFRSKQERTDQSLYAVMPMAEYAAGYGSTVLLCTSAAGLGMLRPCMHATPVHPSAFLL